MELTSLTKEELIERIKKLEQENKEYKQNESYFKRALLESPIILTRFDCDLKYTWVYNPHPDFNSKYVIGKRDDDIVNNDGVQSLLRLKKAVIQNKKKVVDEISFPLSNGLITYEVIGHPLFDKDGKVIGGTAACTDITEQKKLEKEKETLNNRFFEIFQHANDAMYTFYYPNGIKEDASFLHINQQMVKVLGYSEKEYETLTPFDILEQESIQKILYYREKIESGHYWVGELYFIAKNGDRLPFELSTTKLMSEDGIPSYLAVLRDITDRKKLQQEMTYQLDFNRTVFNSLNMGLLVVKGEKVQLINDMMCNMLGVRNKTEFSSKSDEERLHYVKTIVKNSDVYMNKVFKVRKTGLVKTNMEIELKNGRVIELDYIPISSKEEQTFVWVVRDIGARKKIENELKEAKSNAEKANYMKNIFLSQMSHDLRTPINSIQGFTQILLSEVGRSEKDYYRLEKIENSSKHLIQLIDELLDFSSIESGHVKINFEKIHLKSFIDDCVQSIIKAYDTEICTLFKPLDDQLYVYADPIRLRQVLNNLITNAIKYSNKDEEISIYIVEEQTDINIYIADNGIGIPNQKLNLIFEPFYRIENNMEKWNGTGLGLAIVAKLMEKMKGDYGVESEEGVGTTFWISFKKVDFIKEEYDRKIGNGLPVATRDYNRTEVLYIEDNRDNIEVMGAMLEVVGDFKLTSERTGKKGLEKAFESKPAFIFLDLGLPDMNGLDVLKKLKADEKTKDIPVIAISANAFTATIGELIKEGCAAYITKPVNLDELKRVIKKLMKNE